MSEELFITFSATIAALLAMFVFLLNAVKTLIARCMTDGTFDSEDMRSVLRLACIMMLVLALALVLVFVLFGPWAGAIGAAAGAMIPGAMIRGLCDGDEKYDDGREATASEGLRDESSDGADGDSRL